MNAPWARWSCAAIAVLWVAAAVHYATRELPSGMRLLSAPQAVATRDVTFLDDLTGADAYGHGFGSHTIFEAMLRNIGAARSLVVLDCHLCTDLHRNAPDAIVSPTPLANQLVEALLARKAAVPQLQILLLADPINGLYGAAPAPQLARLAAAGIQVVTADLSALRDRNVLYSPPWRLTLKWWSHADSGGGWLPNPYSDDGPRLTGRAWAQLANLKSSDRRVLITDDGRGIPVGPMPDMNDRSALEVVLTEIHAGGKFDRTSGYKTGTGGLHGIGITAVNALSEWLEAEVRREGHVWTMDFARGAMMTGLKQLGKSERTGTKITFRPDPQIFPDTKFSYDVLHKRLQELAFLTPGARILISDEQKIPRGIDGEVAGRFALR